MHMGGGGGGGGWGGWGVGGRLNNEIRTISPTCHMNAFPQLDPESR